MDKTAKICWSITLCICTCISIIFFSIATSIYISKENYRKSECEVGYSKVEYHRDGCSYQTCYQIKTTDVYTQHCTTHYYDCWNCAWFVTFDTKDGESMTDWIFSSYYRDKGDAVNEMNQYTVGNSYECWYKFDDDDDEWNARWDEPSHTVSIILFTFGSIFALPLAIGIIMLIGYSFYMLILFLRDK